MTFQYGDTKLKMSLVSNNTIAYAGCNYIPQNEILVATTKESHGTMWDDRLFLSKISPHLVNMQLGS
jgi:hypothetical protein